MGSVAHLDIMYRIILQRIILSFHCLYVIIISCESTLYISLNVKELLAQNRRDISILSDTYGILTHDHLVRKRTLNHLSKIVN